jgi:hypothetical protein
MICRYARRAEIAYRVEDDNTMTPTQGPMLCGWGQDAAPEKLVNVPRWLSRNALAGHLLNFPDDCMGCPCFAQSDL